MLTFKKLRKKNIERCWAGFKMLLDDWSPAEWTNAIAGETGEACNLTKKLKRGDKIKIKNIAKELADIVIYTDLAAASLGIDLEEAVRSKFNEVSRRKKCKIKL